jgi:ketopantoate hydroxymethyltransferase
MSVHSEIKKVTTETLRKMKFDKEKITMLTAYDYTTAKMVDAGGVDAILIGDSAANVMAGHETTLPITLDQMIYHAQCVVRGVDRALGSCRFTIRNVSVRSAKSVGIWRKNDERIWSACCENRRWRRNRRFCF